MKTLSKEFAVRFYALVFHMLRRVHDAKMLYKFEDIFGMIDRSGSGVEGSGCIR